MNKCYTIMTINNNQQKKYESGLIGVSIVYFLSKCFLISNIPFYTNLDLDLQGLRGQ